MHKVLVVDDDAGLRLSVKSALLAAGGFAVGEAFDGADALEKIKSNPSYELVILDVDMPRMNGMDALLAIKLLNPKIVVIMMTAHAKPEDAALALELGAFSYLPKPVSSQQLLDLIERATTASQLLRQTGAEDFEVIQKLASEDSSVVLKADQTQNLEKIAEAIHLNSSRKDQPFMVIKPQLSEELMSSDLFGHEKGAFVGAEKRKIGKLQMAEGGTLYVEEFTILPQEVQLKIERALVAKNYSPLGSTREFPSNVRMILGSSHSSAHSLPGVKLVALSGSLASHTELSPEL
ncbi:Transcriptional regulatory protein ZraR [compost metagenome]